MFTPNPDFTEATNAAFADFDARLSKVEADMQKCSEQIQARNLWLMNRQLIRLQQIRQQRKFTAIGLEKE